MLFILQATIAVVEYWEESRDQPEKPTENPSGNVRLDSRAFLILTELFECANQIVPSQITRAAHWHPSACVDANR